MLAQALLLLPALPVLPRPAEDPVPEVRVLGGFVDGEGRPVAGVEVRGRVGRGGRFSVRTDARGRFDAVAGWDRGSAALPEVGCSVVARHPRFARWSAFERVRSGGELDLGTVELEPGGVLDGVALDANGEPLAGAVAYLVDAREHGPPAFDEADELTDVRRASDSAESDADGRFRIVGVPPGAWYVQVKHESTVCRTSGVVTLAAGEELGFGELRLGPLPDEYRIEGVVLDARGAPLPGALVTTSVPAPDRRSPRGARATSTGDGRFRLYLPHLPYLPRAGGARDALSLRVEPPDEMHDELHDNETVDGVRPGARDVVVRLGALRELELLVLDDQGRPVPEYEVTTVVAKRGSSIHKGFRPELLGGGRARLRVPDHPLEVRVRTLDFDDEPVSIPTGPLDGPVTIRLKPLATITGRVTYRGEPVADMPVELVCREPNYLGVVEGHWSGLHYGFPDKGFRTDAEGRFRIPNDFPHIVYHVRAWQPGFAPGLSQAVQVGDPSVEVELKDGGRLEGVVELPGLGARAGRAGIGVEVRQRKPRSLQTAFGRVFNVATDEAGRFVVEHLAEGTWLAYVSLPRRVADELGWDRERVEQCERLPFVVELREGEVTQRTLALGGEPCRLEGRLTVGDKIREGYCTLLLVGPQRLDVAHGGVDLEGRFRLAVREPGTYRLAVHGGPGHHRYKVVTDLVRIGPGPNEWVRDLPRGLWKGEGIRLDPE